MKLRRKAKEHVEAVKTDSEWKKKLDTMFI